MQAYGVSWGDRKGRRRAAIAAATATALLVPAGGLGHAGASGAHASVLQQVIVQALPGALAKAEAAVSAAGGKVTRQLGLVNGFAATVPGGATTLDTSRGVLAVTPDRVLRLQGSSYDPTTDAGAPAAVQAQTGASAYWDQGLYGQGVGVALIDSGVVPVDGLRQNVFYGPDLTPQSVIPMLRNRDTFGHGTMMASLIAGRTDDAARPYDDATNYVGVAPEANLVSIKVADAVGFTTESAVVAGVDWAVQHQNDNGLNIRVINLSVGVPGRSYLFDPLAAAVERAWSSGLTVVAATGNNGASSVDVPAADPYDIAVGASDGTSVADFSNTGNATRSPDLVAPGVHLVGLRDSGSYLDQRYGSTGDVADTLFRGSGTSEATAVTAGAAALVIGQHPGITPDQVKALLKDTAAPLDGETTASEGSGEVNLGDAVDAAVPNGHQSYRHAFGYQMFMSRFYGGSWDGNVWQAPSWSGNNWSGHNWSGANWTGSAWSGANWSGANWSGNNWSGNNWSGNNWFGSQWSGSAWSGNYTSEDSDDVDN